MTRIGAGWLKTREDGKQYICLSTEKQVDPKYTNAVAVLEELGIEIPKELQDKVNK